MDDNSEYLAKEATVLTEEIYDAFRGVSREGGVSWAETRAIDLCGWDVAPLLYHDRDRTWEELVDDPEWRPYPGTGGFACLDAIGFRYFLPPAMIQSMRPPYENDLPYWLTLREKFYEHTLGQWSLIDDRQRVVVARFLIYMSMKLRAEELDGLADEWREALDDTWSHAFPPPRPAPRGW